jgi:hypothetical protein
MYEGELKVINNRLLDITLQNITATPERKKQLYKEYEALKMAKEIIKKAIPAPVIVHKVTEKVVKVGNGYWNKGTTVHKCPSCNYFVSRAAKYCIECGQALEWENKVKNNKE